MRKHFYQSVRALGFMLITFLTGSFVDSHAQGFSTQAQTRLQHVIDSFQSNPANPYVGGISAAIKVDGLAFWQGTTGYAARNVDGDNNLLPGGTAFTTSTLSRMYSVTKTFTASLVLELAKEGIFGLDDEIGQYFPFAQVNPGLNSSVTIRQLLAHESGYSDYTDELQLQIAVAFQPTHVWTPYETVSFVHQIAAPGTTRRYSSTNYIILGAIIEALTGKPVEQHFRERFFTPLALNSIYFGVREPQPAGTVLAAPHDNLSPFNPIFQLTGQPTFPDAYTNISAFPFAGIVSLAFTGGALVSNVADMAEWGNSLFGGRATSRSTLDMMLNSISTTPDADGDFLGYGIFRTTRISSTDVFIGHDGNAPGYRSVMFYQPEKKMTIAILTNYSGAKLYAVAKALYEALPEFTCGNKNKKEDKIIVCFNGNSLCVDRNAAAGFINRGAYLGNCENSPTTKSDKQIEPKEISKGQESQLLAYPNPFSGGINLSFDPKTSGKHNLSIYDMNGKFITSLYNKVAESEIRQNIEWDGGSLAAGTYFVALQTPVGIQRQKILLIK